MIAPEFLDTNILVYAYDVSAARKRHVAQELLKRALAGEVILSTQVLAEFAATLLYKLTPPLKARDLMILLEALEPIKVVPIDGETIRRAVEAKSRYQLRFYDGMILASAERAGCSRIWSEDFNPGQQYFGMRVENPFTESA